MKTQRNIAEHGKPTAIEPHLRWAGGKRQIVKQLMEHLPKDVDRRVYREPFLGAGSLFLALQPRKAFLSDANGHLIECYRQVRDNPMRIHAYLREHAARSSETYYYGIRDRYNRACSSIAQAARFIYLNKTCFNGIFRVNTRGEFNVPYGRKEPPPLPSRKLLESISGALRCAKLGNDCFGKALANASASDFIYLDPPYPPLNGTAYFTHYTADRFAANDQRRLAELVRELHARGCKLMMTNANTPLIRRLYTGFNLFKLSVTRYVTCKATKHRVSELVITNYNVATKRLSE